MKRFIFCFIILFIASSCRGERFGEGSDQVRKPVFAGQFYASDPKLLRNTLKSFFDQAKKPEVKDVAVIVVPHAGYLFSGQIAADAFNQAKNNHYDVIVVLGTNHTTADFNGISVYPKGAFGTPIGDAEIDEATVNAILKEDPSVTTNLAVHEKEHSIEVEIPFIKYLFPEARIVPAIVSTTDQVVYKRFGHALANVLKNKKALVVASSDLSHYPHFDDALNTDNKTLNTIATLDMDKISSEMQSQVGNNVPELVTCACGEAPILAAVVYAKEIGAKNAAIVSYSNSGYNPLAGDVNKVVGYGAVAISTGESPGSKVQSSESGIQGLGSKSKVKQEVKEASTQKQENGNSPTTNEGNAVPGIEINNRDLYSYQLTGTDKEELLQYARKTLAQYFWTQTVPLPRGNGPLIKMKRGAFVTLRINGELRGCIGHMAEDIPLYTTVGSMALNAAFNDSRFDPLRPDEFPKVNIEISVLTPFKQVKGADDIVLGRDGVVVKKNGKQAVFLPQVATEQRWDKQTFLDQLCLKAGLDAGDWKDASLYTFQADVFEEK